MDAETKERFERFRTALELLQEEHGFGINCGCEGYGGTVEYWDTRVEPSVGYDEQGRRLPRY